MQKEHVDALEKAYKDADTWRSAHKVLKRKFDLQLQMAKDKESKSKRMTGNPFNKN